MLDGGGGAIQEGRRGDVAMPRLGVGHDGDDFCYLWSVSSATEMAVQKPEGFCSDRKGAGEITTEPASLVITSDLGHGN